ncbi:MAG: hypothetical protein LC742_09320 [Acidobacteria bacterium]|nr:hypothetical protein [Acidobacteriota bacterium]
MMRTRKSTARNGEEQSGEDPHPQKASARHSMTSDELERQMQSALEDVYEVLQLAGDDAGGIVWTELELVNDLTH